MKKFFISFINKHKISVVGFSLLRLFAFTQVLFWPFALAKIIDILTTDSSNWQEVLIWAGLMVLNKILEDITRLESKFGLEKIAYKFKIALATFFTENTDIKEGAKTGEAVQVIREASDEIEASVIYYKDSLLQLPINFIFVPIILFNINLNYLAILIVYAFLYLILDNLWSGIYAQKFQDQIMAAEKYWGTTYRKTPEIWRKREDGAEFAGEMVKEGDELVVKTIDWARADYSRWVFVQVLSSTFLGSIVLYIIYRILNGQAPAGDLVLAIGYFNEVQASLNILTSAVSQFIQTKTALGRLAQTIEMK